MLEVSSKRITSESKDILENKGLFVQKGRSWLLRQAQVLSSRLLKFQKCTWCDMTQKKPLWSVHSRFLFEGQFIHWGETQELPVCVWQRMAKTKAALSHSAEPRLGKRTSEAMCFLVFRFTVQAHDVASLEKLLWSRSSPSKEFSEQRREFTSLSGVPLGWCCLYGCIWSGSWVRIRQLCHFSSSVLSLRVLFLKTALLALIGRGSLLIHLQQSQVDGFGPSCRAVDGTCWTCHPAWQD